MISTDRQALAAWRKFCTADATLLSTLRTEFVLLVKHPQHPYLPRHATAFVAEFFRAGQRKSTAPLTIPVSGQRADVEPPGIKRTVIVGTACQTILLYMENQRIS